jgi:hypothetical protein
VSAQPDPVAGPGAPVSCPLCGEPAGPADLRCRVCGMTLRGLPGRPPAFSRAALWWAVGGLLLIYLVVLAVVAVVH